MSFKEPVLFCAVVSVLLTDWLTPRLREAVHWTRLSFNSRQMQLRLSCENYDWLVRGTVETSCCLQGSRRSLYCLCLQELSWRQFLRNVGNYLRVYTASQLRGPTFAVVQTANSFTRCLQPRVPGRGDASRPRSCDSARRTQCRTQTVLQFTACVRLFRERHKGHSFHLRGSFLNTDLCFTRSFLRLLLFELFVACAAFVVVFNRQILVWRRKTSHSANFFFTFSNFSNLV